MKYKYLFHDDHNCQGHEYTSFDSDTKLTNELANELQKKIQGAGRTGVGFSSFKEICEKNGIKIQKSEEPYFPFDVEIMHGISGNY